MNKQNSYLQDLRPQHYYKEPLIKTLLINISLIQSNFII